MFKNTMKFVKDTHAMASMSVMDIVIATAIGLLVLVAVFQMAPMLGNSIDDAVDIGYDVAATGTFDVLGECGDTETMTIGDTTFELNWTGGVTAGNVDVPIADSLGPTVTAALTIAIGNNATTAALVTATNPTTTSILLTAVTAGVDGNNIVTTDTMNHASFGAATLVGGQTGVSEWNNDDIPTGVDVWAENASVLLLIVLVAFLSLAIMIIRGLQ